MERAIEVIAAISFLVIGISHVVQPRAWAEFFVWLRGKGAIGSFANGFLSLWFGALVVGFHNVWTGIPALLTVIGWAQVVKGAVAFVHPPLALKSMGRVSLENARMFVAPGAAMAAIGGLLVYHLVRFG